MEPTMHWTVALAMVCALESRGQPQTASTQEFHFTPTPQEKDLPERYRLVECRLNAELKLKQDLPLSGISIYELTFPSPVKSPHVENNTVYAEYYRPRGDGPFPCVIILDISAGNAQLPRIMARHLAQNGIAGLFVPMAYYGPRRPKEGRVRMLSYDVNHTLGAIRQTVLDLRLATAWMASRPEIDKERLGILGTSLGSFMAALTAEMEPRLSRVAVLLGGGGYVDGFWDHPVALPYRKAYESLGGTRKMVEDLLAPVDPLTYAGNLKGRKVLMMAAKNDEVVPPRMAENLWKATGKQRIIWLDSGHYTAALYLVTGLEAVVEHFSRD